MAYLVINGLTVSCARATPVQARRATRGRSTKGITGDATEARRTSKAPWDCETKPMPPDEAESLENLLAGRGHVWDLTGNLSSSGGAGIRSTTGTIVTKYFFAGGPYADAAYTQVASSLFVDFVAGLTSSTWTMMAAAKPSGTGAFEWYGFRSSGNYVRNGVVQGAASLSWAARQANGDIRITGKDNAAANADLPVAALVALPWLVPDAPLKTLTTWLTRRWGSLPKLDVSGSITPATSGIYARATINSSKHMRAVDNGTYKDNRRTVSFSLMEI